MKKNQTTSVVNDLSTNEMAGCNFMFTQLFG